MTPCTYPDCPSAHADGFCRPGCRMAHTFHRAGNMPGWKRHPDKPPRTKAEILIRDHDMKPLFVLQFWGLTARDLCIVPDGGDLVEAALRRRGIDPHSVMFTIWDVAVA